ncbi:zinc-dependent metalloprotease [Sphingomonas sp.]|uniref:zinc-dependent metalloprotease n=1 Tax=Sphingomonas sp. TaxID=28214 RepID=UPI000DB5EC72|nr:zinc-dependent metalloprotease [Sphingomonas sp.]PZU10882.1 MAG: peptidase [Sphingomonas sp.]
MIWKARAIGALMASVWAANALDCAVAQAPAAALLPVRAVAGEGRVFFTLPAPDAQGIAGRYLYASSIREGLGSADITLDRGMTGSQQILAFKRIGKKVAVIFENHQFRATGDADVVKGGIESFPVSVIAMLDVVSTDASGALVVDVTPFLGRDVVGIADRLGGGASFTGGNSAAGGRGFRLAEALSAVDAASLKAFPDNIEVDALQTFTSDQPGRDVSSIAPDRRQVSFIVHHSFVRLPAPGFVPLKYDQRSGTFGDLHYDYGTPLGQDVAQIVANRFRLEKVDPSAPRSKVKKPIIFYIDTAAPEPVRTALMEGVNYWKTAFDKAGFIDAFEARILPPGADPLDVRYNMVNWTNRLTRGWSYGGGITDPRTGEIVKGNVVLGALRVRQDMILFEGLVGTAEENKGTANDPVRVSLSRIRQLGAHEVGHALGFQHNFIGSTEDRTSVMEYPFPRIKLVDGKIDLSDAYKDGGGAWDDFTVDWLYSVPPPGVDPDKWAWDKAQAIQGKVRYVIDGSRGPEGVSPYSSMWDDGPDPTASLKQIMAVRRVALNNFGPGVLHHGEPMANLQRVFVPVWLLHRYSVYSAAKAIGGIDYDYLVVGDGRDFAKPAPAAMQTAALDALLETLSSKELTVPDRLVMPLSSAATGPRNVQFSQEVFKTAAYTAFDPLVAADVAAQITLDALLDPTRLIRVYEQHRRDPSLPGLDLLLDRITAATVDQRGDAVARRVAYRALITMARVARDPESSPDVVAIVNDRLRTIAGRLARGGAGEDGAWSRSVAKLLTDEDMLAREFAKKQVAPTIPPGMPIGGSPDFDWMEPL